MHARLELPSWQKAGAALRLSLVIAGHAILLMAASVRAVDHRSSKPRETHTPFLVPSPSRGTETKDASGGPPLPPVVTVGTVLPPPEIPLVGTSVGSGVENLDDIVDSSSDTGSLAEALRDGGVDGVIGAREVDHPPDLISIVEPEYPPALASARIGGRVVLEFVVDTAGRVREGSLRTVATTDEAFVAAAERAILEQARFRPGRHRGVAVPTIVRQAIVFRVGEAGGY